MAKFADLVKEWGITPEQIVAASLANEVRSADDRLLAIARRSSVKSSAAKGDAPNKLVEAKLKKPRLGRGVTLKTVDLAIAGVEQSRIVRGKLVRAVNKLAKLKKKNAVSAIDLFGETKRKKGKAPVKKGPKK